VGSGSEGSRPGLAAIRPVADRGESEEEGTMPTEGPEEWRDKGQGEGRGEEDEELREEPERAPAMPTAESGVGPACAERGEGEAQGPSPASDADPPEEPVGEGSPPFDVDPDILQYVQMVTGLIEGRSITRAEILAMLERMGRQRSMAGEKWIDYVLRVLEEKPP
jgi:hypothetical protein